MATIGLWSLKAYHSVGLNATAPFGGRGDVYGGDPIEPDGVLDSAAGDSVCAPSATVIQVVEQHIDLRVAREEIAAQIALEAAARLGIYSARSSQVAGVTSSLARVARRVRAGPRGSSE